MYFLYYNGGSCNDGDHSCGFETFDTLKEAEDRQKEVFNSDTITIIIQGEIVKQEG